MIADDELNRRQCTLTIDTGAARSIVKIRNSLILEFNGRVGVSLIADIRNRILKVGNENIIPCYQCQTGVRRVPTWFFMELYSCPPMVVRSQQPRGTSSKQDASSRKVHQFEIRSTSFIMTDLVDE